MVRKALPLILSGACLFGASQSADAATLLTQTLAPDRSDFSGTIGVVFTVGGFDLSVTALGFQDAAGDGLASAHQVGIWNSTGTLVATVTVSSGTGGVGETFSNNYRYSTNLIGISGPTSAVTLLANTQYTIGAQVFNGGDAWTGNTTATGFTMSTDAAPNNAVFVAGGFARPTGAGGGSNLRWAPGNMQYTVVPEPSVALLGGFGMLGLLRRRRS